MNGAIGAILLIFASSVVLAFDPLAIDWRKPPANDDERIVYTLLYEGDRWEDKLNAIAENLGNEKVGERIVEFVEPVFEDACTLSFPDKKYVLCWSGLQALGYVKATNSLPFLERAVLHGREDLCRTALFSCHQIMGYGDAYIGLLDRALENGAITRDFYATELTGFIWSISHGRTKVTSEIKLKIAIRHMKNPYGYYREGSGNDDFILAVFPPYSNSVERITALTAMLENQLTPPEGHAKYGPERDRLRALPPESLVHAADELQTELDALQRAAECKEKRARILRIAVPSAAVLLVLVAVVVFVSRLRHGRKARRP